MQNKTERYRHVYERGYNAGMAEATRILQTALAEGLEMKAEPFGPDIVVRWPSRTVAVISSLLALRPYRKENV